MHRTNRFNLAIILLTLALASCKADTSHEVHPVISTPLPLDPTDDFDFRGWWVGDDQMLVLNHDQSYLRYNGLNRYLSQTQRGRWSQMTYASLRLEPYGRMAPDPLRVRVQLIDGQRALLIGDRLPMFAADAPPATPEDDLMGTWGGESGELRLSPDMRYIYTPSSRWMTAHATVLPAGQRGGWMLIGNEVTLRPDSPAFDRMILKHNQEDRVERLDGETMAFERAVEGIADSADAAEAGDTDSAIVTGDDG